MHLADDVRMQYASEYKRALYSSDYTEKRAMATVFAHHIANFRKYIKQNFEYSTFRLPSIINNQSDVY